LLVIIKRAQTVDREGKGEEGRCGKPGKKKKLIFGKDAPWNQSPHQEEKNENRIIQGQEEKKGGARSKFIVQKEEKRVSYRRWGFESSLRGGGLVLLERKRKGRPHCRRIEGGSIRQDPPQKSAEEQKKKVVDAFNSLKEGINRKRHYDGHQEKPFIGRYGGKKKAKML